MSPKARPAGVGWTVSAPHAISGRLAPIVGARALLAAPRAKDAARCLADPTRTRRRWCVHQRRGRVLGRGSRAAGAADAGARLRTRREAGAATAGLGYRIRADSESQLDAAWPPRAGTPVTTPARVDVSLDGSAPASVALAAVLLRILDMLEANVDGSPRSGHRVPLHDLRISVRRTRSGLTLAGGLAGRPGWPRDTPASSSGSAT